jgi:glycosyltransferase involved in cell wall biosynthesis
MAKISVVIITLNEEKYINQCIISVKGVADEIVVVDSFSTDRTKEICLSHGVRFIEHPFNGFRDQKNYALSLATYDYVLALDADEALSPELEKSIHKIKHDLKYDGYKFRRLNSFCGRWIYYTNLSPDRKIRLFNRKKAQWGGLNIHEKIILDNPGSVKLIKGKLFHWLYDSYEESIEKINKYTTLLAAEYYAQNIKFSIRKLLIHPIWRFFHSYFLKAGFLDGFDGFTVSKILATTCFLKYLKLRNISIQAKMEKEIIYPGFMISDDDKSDNPERPGRSITIGFDAKRAFYNFSGLGNYSRNLLSVLAKERPENSYYLFTAKSKNRCIMGNEDRFKLVEPKSGIYKYMKSVWRRKFIVNDIIRQKIDIYHGLSQELPAGIRKTGVKSIVTVHDLIFMRYPEFYRWIDKKIYYWKLEHACRVSDSIVAISQQTKSDLVSFLKISPDKITVIYQGCNSCFRDKYSEEFRGQIKAKYDLPDRYLLYVGTIEERKNLMGVVKAIHTKSIKLPVVVVGRRVDHYYRTIQDYIRTHNLNNFIFLDNVLNLELAVIYQNAECFIYPSFFEGFGIPILEALVSKTPVITSSTSCLAEAAGPGSLFIDPYDHENLGDAIFEVINNKDLRDKMIAAGTEYANKFTDEAVAKSYMKLYHSLLQ